MVSLQTVQQSNAAIAKLPQGLVAVFIGATSGIGLSSLQQLAQYARAPRIYTVARPAAVAAHEKVLASLRETAPSGTYNLITADVSLVSEIDKVVEVVKKKETKLDLLYMSPGFMAFEGRIDTREGLDPSMSTRYYSRLRALQQLLPLLNNAYVPSPRVISVLAGGMEAPLNESDLDLKDPANWTFWTSSLHSATMGTLAFEKFAKENPRLNIIHWSPGPVDTPGLARAKAANTGFNFDNTMTQDEAGARALFAATSDYYAVQGGLVPAPDGLGVQETTGGGIFLVKEHGQRADNEAVLAEFRKRNVGDTVWKFTEEIFATCV